MCASVLRTLAAFLLLATVLYGQEKQSLGEYAAKLKAERAAKPDSSLLKEPPASTSITTPNLNTGDEAEKYKATVMKLFADEKFNELEKLAALARSSKARFPGGGWKLRTFYHGVDGPAAGNKANDTEWAEYLLKLKRWMSSQTTSITAPVALADAYVSYAWKARGNGFADTVSDDGWRIFQERINLAEGILKHASALKEKCPQWYLVMQLVAEANNWSPEEKVGLLQEATAFEPQYYYYYQVQAYMLLPKWDGEEGDSAKFAQASADRMGGKQGEILYYLIAASLICDCGNENPQAGFDWARTKSGYSALVEQYGVSLLRQNEMCYMAARVGDVVLADDLFTAIGDKWDESIWKKKERFDEIKAGTKDLRNIVAIYTTIGQNMKTPEGKQYSGVIAGEFAAHYAQTAQECLSANGQIKGSVDVVFQVGQTGVLQQLLVYPHTPVDGCVRTKMEKAAFSPPPTEAYWVKVRVNLP